MSDSYRANDVLNALVAASKTLSERQDEINRLNVFPVPDGDTGTNMSLTLESVVKSLAQLPENASGEDTRKAITTGALMGARGNSGVITSQILRGFCEGSVKYDTLTTEVIDAAFARAVDVAFQAVRKPVEGTILTVLRDTAAAAKRANRKHFSCDETLNTIVEAAFTSVQHTPELLAILKENGVVDAGGYGFAILLDAFSTAIQGKGGMVGQETQRTVYATPKVEIEQINDWEGSQYRYCTEFLVHSETVDVDAAKRFLPTMGDCDLMVGNHPNFKVHVHSNRPDKVLRWFLTHDAQISEVHVHNMDLQSEARNEALAVEQLHEQAHVEERKPFGVVAVAVGEGNAKILESLGADVVVKGGQTMNPSTKDLLDAVEETHADNVIILPNNGNIIMAAESASNLAEVNCGVIPTKSVPQGFSALFGYNPSATLEENLETMAESCEGVKTGEVTWAIKDSKDAHGNPIKTGDVIGIADGSIEAVDSTVEGAVKQLLVAMEVEDFDTLTLLAGADFDDDRFEKLTEEIEETYPDLDVDAHRGDQPLHPIVMSVE
ncbi:MAG: DAK2 domain-containing protein [Eggerthellaceae bacterium]|jgi:DAK2 domain fusion protein YloV